MNSFRLVYSICATFTSYLRVPPNAGAVANLSNIKASLPLLTHVLGGQSNGLTCLQPPRNKGHIHNIYIFAVVLLFFLLSLLSNLPLVLYILLSHCPGDIPPSSANELPHPSPNRSDIPLRIASSTKSLNGRDPFHLRKRSPSSLFKYLPPPYELNRSQDQGWHRWKLIIDTNCIYSEDPEGSPQESQWHLDTA